MFLVSYQTVPCLGYLSRTTIHYRRLAPTCPSLDLDDDFQEDVIDEAVVMGSSGHESLTSKQYVVHSATFQVPAFYFTIHDSRMSDSNFILSMHFLFSAVGSPLPLKELVHTSLFHPFAFEGTEVSDFALSLPAASFPLLSHGDHPTLGTPSWYFHPCESATAVEQIMSELQAERWSEEKQVVRWLEAWFMITGSVVDLSTR